MPKTIVIFLLCSTYFASAQSYIPLLADSLHWYGSYQEFGWYRTADYTVIGDTMINGTNYRYMDRFHYNKNVFLREDTAARKLYYRQLSGFKANEDILLYDFSLGIRDSMLIFNPNTTYPDSMGYFVLDSIAQTTVKTGDVVDVFHLSNHQTNAYTYWIEGVGGPGLINGPGGLSDDSTKVNVACLFKDGVHFFESELAADFGTCMINTIGIKEEAEDAYSIYPNPVLDVLNISKNSDQALRYKIFHVSGELLNEGYCFDSSCSIDVSDLSTGMYLIQISSRDSQRSIKFVVE